MTSTTKTGSRSRGPVAVSETNGHKPEVKFRGLKLTLVPAQESGDVVFAIADDEISEALRTVMGAEQYQKVRAKCKEERLTIPQTVEALRGLLTDCMAEYGIGAGE